MTDPKRQVDYDAVAPTYDVRYAQPNFPGTLQALLTEIADGPELRVLEVGCGTGHWLQELASRGVRVSGLDSSQGMLDQARQRLPQADLVLGSAQSLPWADETFDRVFCINAVHHFHDKPGFVREAYRVLKKSGKLLVVGLDPSIGVDSWYVYEYFEETRALDERRYPTVRQIESWMEETGFDARRSLSVEQLDIRMPASEALERGMIAKAATSQLSILTDEEYERGLTRIRAAMAQAQDGGEQLWLEAKLRLYGTLGTRQS